MKKIILNKINYTSKVPERLLLKYLQELESYFDIEVLDLIKNNYNIISYPKILKHIYFSIDKISDIYLCDIKEVIYSEVVNNKLKNWNKSYFHHDEEDHRWLKGCMRGRKRPEHSKIMKVKMKIISNNRSDDHKKNLECFHKERFKRKRLSNQNLLDDKLEYSDEEINNIYCKFISNLNKSFEYRKNYIIGLKNNQRYDGDSYYEEWKKNFNNVEITTDNIGILFTSAMSCISSIAYADDTNDMGKNKFTRDILFDFKFETTGKLSQKFKSSYETKSVIFFETNKIPWSYEPLHIIYNEGHFYTPDFKIKLEDVEYLIELKGYIRNEIHKDKINNQMISLSKELGNKYKICYITKPIESIEDIKNNIINND